MENSIKQFNELDAQEIINKSNSNSIAIGYIKRLYGIKLVPKKSCKEEQQALIGLPTKLMSYKGFNFDVQRRTLKRERIVENNFAENIVNEVNNRNEL